MLRAIVCAALMLVSSSASAGITVERYGDKSLVWIRGDIVPGMARKVLDAVASNVTVVLTSEGGDIAEAIDIARAIQSLGASTLVAGKCESACAPIFAAGTKRWFLPGSYLAFHSPFVSTWMVEGRIEYGRMIYVRAMRESSPALGDWLDRTRVLFQRDLRRVTYEELHQIAPGWVGMAGGIDMKTAEILPDSLDISPGVWYDAPD